MGSLNGSGGDIITACRSVQEYQKVTTIHDDLKFNQIKIIFYTMFAKAELPHSFYSRVYRIALRF
jgi:hypothetical protein